MQLIQRSAILEYMVLRNFQITPTFRKWKIQNECARKQARAAIK